MKKVSTSLANKILTFFSVVIRSPFFDGGIFGERVSMDKKRKEELQLLAVVIIIAFMLMPELLEFFGGMP